MSSSSSKRGSDSSSASLSKGSIDLPTMFADVKPILQDDGPSPVCVIAYPPDFEEAMNYFRALLLTHEYSVRALELTAICLKFNPANYTVWHYRRECLKALSTSTGGGISMDMDLVENDLEFSAAIGGSNPKNYQIWYHRRALLESIVDTKLFDKLHVSTEDWKERIFDVTRKELMYVSIVLNEDAKNYHVS
jgi:protein farnesyltransferase/geranylgeranyltransferase type-1 subunit alpha